MKKLLIMLLVASIFALISCGESDKSNQSNKINVLESKGFNTSAKKVEAFGYWVTIWKLRVDSIEYTLGTTSSHAPITILDKRIIKRKKKKK